MLFGHQNDDSQQTAAAPAVSMGTNVNPLAVDPATGVSLPAAPPTPPSPPAEFESPSVLNQPGAAATQDLMTPPPAPLVQPTTAPIADIAGPLQLPAMPGAPEPSMVPSAPSVSEPTPEPEPQTPAEPLETPSPFARSINDATGDATSAPADDDMGDTADLLDIKQQALSELDPLVDKLDQTPEEKFRTTMMLIQSTDNPSRLPAAYKAAQAITDEKVRAQALLDVVNEINYFTHSKPADQPTE